jgi:hypothetical protein
VNSPVHERRLVWAFWIASGLAAVGGIAPLVFAGTSGRVGGVLVPFWVAAVALGACAIFYRQGRPLVTGLYFIAGLAVVYGMLLMLSVPLRLLVIGTCPPLPANCLPGLEKPLTEGETTGLWFAVGIGALAIFVGFFGLVALFRRPALMPSAPPVRNIPPVEDHPAAAPTTEPVAESAAIAKKDSETESPALAEAAPVSDEAAPSAPVRKPPDDAATPSTSSNE